MKNAANQLVGTYSHKTAPLGAGGFVTGMRMSSDGQRLVHWTDVYNGYIRNVGEQAWLQLFRTDTLLPVEYDPLPFNPNPLAGGRAMYAAAIAPSNKDVIYADFNGYVYKSVNGGLNYLRTAAPQKITLPGSGASRRFNHTLSVHPTDPNTVIRGTNNDGVQYTTNGGTSWSSVASLPATTIDGIGGVGGVDGKYLTAFDPGDPNIVYIHAFGAGLYRSMTGVTGVFAFVAGGPSRASHMTVTAAGVVFIPQYRLTDPVIDGLKRMTRLGVWSAVTGSEGADQCAINPNDPLHIVWTGENGGFAQTRDGGVTFTNNGTIRGDGEVQWFSNRQKTAFPSMMMFDPVADEKVWITEGLGICFVQCPVAAEVATLHDYSAGNEELIVTGVTMRPGNPVPIFTSWDKPIWRMENLERPTNIFSYPPNTPAGGVFQEAGVTIGHSVDWAIDDDQFLACTVGQGETRVGTSNDFGRTWTAYTGAPSGGWVGSGGCVAVSNKNNIVHTMSNNGGAYYTKNGGTSWSPVTLGLESPPLEWANGIFVTRHNVTADKQRPGVFALLVNDIIPGGLPGAGGLGRANSGVWVTTDQGDNWTRKKAGLIHTLYPGNSPFRSTPQYWQAKISYVPGFSGELLYADCEGNVNPMMWSQDDGATWTDVRGDVRSLIWFGFGKAAPGQTRPAVFFIGYVGGTDIPFTQGILGIYASYDWFATTPVLITRFPNCLAAGDKIEGDPNIFGRHFVGIGGFGAQKGDYGKKFTLT